MTDVSIVVASPNVRLEAIRIVSGWQMVFALISSIAGAFLGASSFLQKHDWQWVEKLGLNAFASSAGCVAAVVAYCAVRSSRKSPASFEARRQHFAQSKQHT